MTNTLLFLFLIVIRFPLTCNSQTDIYEYSQQEPFLYQFGLILPEIDTATLTINSWLLIPEEGFNIYDAPGGNITGVLTRQTEMYESLLLKYADKNKPVSLVELVNAEEVGSEEFALRYFERRDGFLRILSKEDNYWVRETELERQGFETVDYLNFFLQNSIAYHGYYANEPGLNLHEYPTENSSIIKTIQGDLLMITPQDEFVGNWMKVIVVESYENPCNTDVPYEENMVNVYHGWIKMVNDNGERNVWWYPRGC